MPEFVPLDRRFVRWDAEGEADIDYQSWFPAGSGTFDWHALTERLRVVILAEAGSGKSSELKEQQRRLAAEGKACFLTTLQRIGQKQSFENALGKAEWRRFRELEATGEPCWLLLDSIDEAKRADFALSSVLIDVADAIDGCAGRVHIILSGRMSDWEFKRDLATLLERIPIPPSDEAPEHVSADQELIDAVNHEAPKTPEPPEKPLIVAMAALDRSRVETFARARGITDLDAMFADLDGQNLWSFARRPTDLGWLVGYRQTYGKFGSLHDMLDVSINERLKETNPELARKDPLDHVKARKAVERIGAALVLQRVDTIVTPDTDRETRDFVSCLDLKDIVPDLTAPEQSALINRAVFNPATPGFIRLHNDNTGEVRGFLAAKWLHRLRREANLPVARLFELLFADTYGVSLVRPSLRSTSAWLSLWEPEVAQEVLRRDPRLLMDAGDPASLSLEVRLKALKAMIALAARDEHFAIPNQDALRRFARPDLAEYIRDLWAMHRTTTGPRVLLLLIIHLGAITDCADIAREAATGGYEDRYTAIFAGRALLSSGTPEQLRAYLDFLIANARRINPVTACDALENLYPGIATSADFLALTGFAISRAESADLDLRYYGPRLAARIPDTAAAHEILEALMSRLDVRLDIFREKSTTRDDDLLETVEVAAARYAKLLPSSKLPPVIVDAAVRIGESRRLRAGLRRRASIPRDEGDLDLEGQINASPQRRRIALWRCTELFREAKERPLTAPWQLQFIGLAPRLQAEDIDWLIKDIAARSDIDDLRLATNGALALWRSAGENPLLLARIRTANAAAAVQDTITAELSPPDSDFELQAAKSREREARDAIEQARTDQSWIDFRNALQADPGALLHFHKPENDKVDGRLYHLWRLLSGLGDNSSRHAIADIAPLRRLFGQEVAEAFRCAMMAHWRHLAPKLPAELPPAERNSTFVKDLMGMVGVTLEAAAKPGWAANLNDDEVRLATQLAVRELNGFPKWLDDLALAHPGIVAELLWQNLQPDLDPYDQGNRKSLQDLASASETVANLMSPRLAVWHADQHDIPAAVLEHVLRLIKRIPGVLADAMPVIAARAREPRDRWGRAAYFGAAFLQDPQAATDQLLGAVEELAPEAQIPLVQAVLPEAFGSRFDGGDLKTAAIPFSSLVRLVELAMDKIQDGGDHDRRSIGGRPRDERDRAEDARDALFNALVVRPGYATYAALQRFREIPGFPVRDHRLQTLAFERAEADSEQAAMRVEDVLTFERDHDFVPATSADLQRVGMARLRDIEYYLLHDDFNQGLTAARLPREVDVQNWFADALRTRQGRSYSLEREPHVFGEKEPDIRLTSLRDPGARSPIEIKVASSWSLTQLEEALTLQLQDRYLRDRENRFGILLVVHNKEPERQWKRDGYRLDFGEVMKHLAALASKLAAADALAPQMVTIGIDLSGFASRVAAEERSDTQA